MSMVAVETISKDSLLHIPLVGIITDNWKMSSPYAYTREY
ncbi:hypothetical protein SEHO0A_02591 [Salmonella enterica subsp. houtenae str. ATCC BAA-1581]|nr:hypothetical protein SEHO0A_02591 [Salmonella enterica subsp. houtenae str. ATCC BAA-1581]ENZ85957.1 hypothetical protein D088_910008 [Salmonella enterica subsp. houtenae serovar 16:z4,z32:-- str. RKS3027]